MARTVTTETEAEGENNPKLPPKLVAELHAIQGICELLMPLDQTARGRVLTWATERFETWENG